MSRSSGGHTISDEAEPEDEAPADYLDTLYQLQPRPPTFNTILRLPKTSQASKVHNWLVSFDQDEDQQQQQRQPQPQNQDEPTSPSDLRSDLRSDPSMNSHASNSGVGDADYRKCNLAYNGVYFRDVFERLPRHIQGLADEILSKGRQSPEPTVEDVKNDPHLAHLRNIDGGKDRVIEYCRHYIFEHPQYSEQLQGLDIRQTHFSIRRQHIPNCSNSFAVNFPISQPKPDIFYGYIKEAFTSAQQQVLSLHNAEHTTGDTGVYYPLFIIELKGDGEGPAAGSLWAAENQCLGSAAACISMVDKLSKVMQLLSPMSTISPVDPIAFSIAMNGTQARLLISWKENGGDYYTQQIRDFVIHRPEEFIQFRRVVRNVLEWGKDYRREQIGAVLEQIKAVHDAIPGKKKSTPKRALDSKDEQIEALLDTIPGKKEPPPKRALDSEETTLRRSKRLRRLSAR